MGGTAAIEHNRQALKRILAAIVAMAGLSLEPILPRRLYLAVLRLLRPAESATRRLIIAMARGLAVTLPPPRPHKAAHKIKILPLIVRDGAGTGIVLPSGAPIPGSLAHLISSAPKRCLRTLALTDAPLRWRARRRPAAAASIPRIAVPGVTTIFAASARKPPAPDDAIDASRLVQRLDVLRRALDDLPGQARRLALWRARQGRSRGARPLSPSVAAAAWTPARRTPVALRSIRHATAQYTRGRRGSCARPCACRLCPGASRHVVTVHPCGKPAFLDPRKRCGSIFASRRRAIASALVRDQPLFIASGHFDKVKGRQARWQRESYPNAGAAYDPG